MDFADVFVIVLTAVALAMAVGYFWLMHYIGKKLEERERRAKKEDKENNSDTKP